MYGRYTDNDAKNRVINRIADTQELDNELTDTIERVQDNIAYLSLALEELKIQIEQDIVKRAKNERNTSTNPR